jgi:hypothetical protein
MDKEKKYFARWWFWVLGLIIATAIIFGILRIAGVIGERIIFEQSFQYKEARKTEIATFEAQLAEIERKLSSPIDENTRANLEAQAASIRIHLKVAKQK